MIAVIDSLPASFHVEFSTERRRRRLARETAETLDFPPIN